MVHIARALQERDNTEMVGYSAVRKNNTGRFRTLQQLHHQIGIRQWERNEDMLTSGSEVNG